MDFHLQVQTVPNNKSDSYTIYLYPENSLKLAHSSDIGSDKHFYSLDGITSLKTL